MTPPFLHRQRGAVAVMVAISILVLLAVVGLVLDAGLGYMVKARLNAAVDSAALAAARAVTAGDSEEAQTSSARQAAERFFAANIPDGYLGSRPVLTRENIHFEKSTGTITVDIDARAPMSVSLLQVLGFKDWAPEAHAQTIRRDLDMAFVVDTSGSLGDVGSSVRASAKSFLEKFNMSQDRVGLVHFASGAKVDTPIYTTARGFDRPAMLQAVAGYKFEGGTTSAEGMWHARQQLNTIASGNRSTLRVIVFFSDGEPTALGGYFKFSDQQKCSSVGSLDAGTGTATTYGTSSGLYFLDRSKNEAVSTGCTIANNKPLELPVFYNAHGSGFNDTTQQEFRVQTTTPRLVTADLSTNEARYRNIGRAARNVVEAMAAKAREEGVFVFTLGMGASLKKPSGIDNEVGEDVLQCMANVADGPARCYNPQKPVGMYCYAATEADLTPCFSRLASAILRISQ